MSLDDVDWAAVIFRYVKAWNWTPLQATTECGIMQASLIFGVERDEEGIRQPHGQSSGEQLAIINKARKRKGLAPLQR